MINKKQRCHTDQTTNKNTNGLGLRKKHKIITKISNQEKFT